MKARYNIKTTSPAGKISYLTVEHGAMEWRSVKCDQLIAECKKLSHFAGFTFEKEMV